MTEQLRIHPHKQYTLISMLQTYAAQAQAFCWQQLFLMIIIMSNS